MSEFIWQENYRLGESTIDSQHQNLFMLANNLIDAQNRDSDQAQNIVDRTQNLILLYRHGREHFQTEERFMKLHRYPDYQKHVDAHNSMLNNLVDFSTRIGKNAWRRQDMLKLLSDWIDHILSEDGEVRSYFLNQNPQDEAASSSGNFRNERGRNRREMGR